MTGHPGSGEGTGPQEPAGPGPGPDPGPDPSSGAPPPPQAPPPPGAGYGYGYQYPPGPAPQRRLVRRTDNQIIGGVASGIADYLGIDVAVVRIGFILLIIGAGTGVLLYLLLWLFLPEAGPADLAASTGAPAGLPSALERLGGWRAVAAIALLLIGVGLIAGQFSRPEFFWAVALIALGVYLFRQETRSVPSTGADPAAAAPPAPDMPPHADPGVAPVATDRGTSPAPGPGPAWGGTATATVPLTERGCPPGYPPLPPLPPPSAPAPHPRQPRQRERQRSVLGWVTVAAGLVVTGVAVVLSDLRWFSLTPAGGIALFLVVLGIGLIVSAFRGRAGWLILLGVLLVPVMVAASLLDPPGDDRPWRSGVGTRLWQPASVAEVEPSYRLGGGQLVLDLRQVHFRTPFPQVRVSLGAGQLLVLVPEGQAVAISTRVNAGGTNLLGHVENGLRLESSLADPPDATSPLWLDLRLGTGEIDVRRLPVGADVPEIRGTGPVAPAPETTEPPTSEPTTTKPTTTPTTTTQR